MKKLLRKIKTFRLKKNLKKPFKLSKTLRIGITGAGTQGKQLAMFAKKYGAEIVAVHDINLDSAKKLSKDIDAKFATTDIENFFNVPMDGLLVCTLPTIRVDPILRACSKKIHLLVEKPPAYNLIEGRKCLAAIKKSNVIAGVGFQLRYEPRYKKLKQLVSQHEVHLVRTTITVDYYLNLKMSPWLLKKQISGGPISEQAIHLLDCVRFIFGNPKAIKAATIATKNMARYRKEFDAENSLQLIYELDNGIIGVHTNHCGHDKPRFDLELIGPRLQLEANATETKIHGTINGQKINEDLTVKNDVGLDKVGAWLKAIETNDRHFIQSSYEEAMNTQALVDAAIKSQSTSHIESVESI